MPPHSLCNNHSPGILPLYSLSSVGDIKLEILCALYNNLTFVHNRSRLEIMCCSTVKDYKVKYSYISARMEDTLNCSNLSYPCLYG
jgi:hypothetical protein